MTIKDLMKKRLQRKGLWLNEAVAIMDTMDYEKSVESMIGRWEDNADGYPQELIAVVWASVQQSAAQWLDTNKPKHFARTMFP